MKPQRLELECNTVLNTTACFYSQNILEQPVRISDKHTSLVSNPSWGAIEFTEENLKEIWKTSLKKFEENLEKKLKKLWRKIEENFFKKNEKTEKKWRNFENTRNEVSSRFELLSFFTDK